MLQVKQKLPLVGRRSSICMLMPVRHAAAWLVGRLASSAVAAFAYMQHPKHSLLMLESMAGSSYLVGCLTNMTSIIFSICLPVSSAQRQLNQQILTHKKGPTLSSPPKIIRQIYQQSSVELIIKSIGVMMMKSPKEVSDAGSVQEFRETTQLLFSPKLNEPFLSMF